MKIIFITNFFTPHQEEICSKLYTETENNFFLIETVDTSNKKIPIGWQALKKPDYVIDYNSFLKNKKKYLKEINDSDVVIFGSAPVRLVKTRLKSGRLTFKYSERVYKKKCPWYELPFRAVKYYFQIERHKNLYLLCASAFTAGDYAKTGTFKNRTYRWGYFPYSKEYDIKNLMEEKTADSILWAGRLIDWKHPEIPVKIAKMLKSDGYDFHLNIIGTGDTDDDIRVLIQKENLSENVHLLGSMKPQKVREYMEKSKIFLSTSDRQEGWGAVLNEAMNSGCAIVASSAIGSAPYLIKDGENGFLYKDGDLNDLYKKVKHLLDNSDLRKVFGEKAYRTIANVWNGKVAAERLIALSKELSDKKNSADLYSDGPCSRAKILKDNWYKQPKRH